MAAQPDAGRAPKRRRLEEQHGVVAGVARGEITNEILARKLTDHVERIDMDMVSERVDCIYLFSS